MKKITLLLLLLAFAISLAAAEHWLPLGFDIHGTKRLVVENESRYWFYRAFPGDSLNLQLGQGNSTVKISSMLKKSAENLDYTLKLDGQEFGYQVKTRDLAGKYYLQDDTIISVNPAQIHTITITCPNKNAYFRVFAQ